MSQTVLLIISIAGLVVVAGLVIALLLRRPAANPEAEQRLRELNARLDAMGSWLQSSHTQLQHTVNTRLDAVSQNLGESMKTSTKNTTDHLQQLHARLAVIDSAQKNITDLAGTVTSLQNVLTNKQSRGAFGQGQLEAIVSDVLPKGAYEFQYTLKSGKRPDCAIFMPESGPLIIDAKFPLEAMTALRAAATEDERKLAIARVKTDIIKHVNDIAEKYLVPGETQDIALMFIPSESVYAGLLSDRVNKLKTHFGQANVDIDGILISTGKIEKRGGKIEALEFDADTAASADILEAPIRKLGAAE